MSEVDEQQLENVRKLASRLSFLLWIGLLGMLLSLFEGSVVWAIYCLLTGWIGIAVGFVSGEGRSDYLLGRTPEHRQVTRGQVMMGSLFTYWIPTLCVLVFGLILAGALKEDLQPAAHRNGNSLLMILESAAMYFTAAGASWATVLREAKIAQSKQANAPHGNQGSA
jgi:hypothetical protein